MDYKILIADDEPEIRNLLRLYLENENYHVIEAEDGQRALDFERADKIASYFAGKVKIAFGIGTYISNDTDVPALNIVMKTTKCNGMDVAKISDTPGKGMCKNPEYVEYLQRCISWRMENDR